MPSMLRDPKLDALLDGLYARSKAQEPATNHYFSKVRT